MLVKNEQVEILFKLTHYDFLRFGLLNISLNRIIQFKQILQITPLGLIFAVFLNCHGNRGQVKKKFDNKNICGKNIDIFSDILNQNIIK